MRTDSAPTPVWGRDSDGRVLGTGGRAAQSDRDDRAAWGVVLRSAYHGRVALPDSVAAGDTATARAILGRIQEALVEECQWTKAERVRLRAMAEAWERRVGGEDLGFTVGGWVRRKGKGETDRQRLAREEGRAMQKVKEALLWEQGTDT